MLTIFWLPIALALLATTVHADTVLGGIVDNLPKCYHGSDSLLYVEYNSGGCHIGIADQGCTCDTTHSPARRAQLADTGNNNCVFVTKLDTYIFPEQDMNDIVNIPNDTFTKNLVSTTYYSGVYNGQSNNAPVIQALGLNKASTHIGLSLWKGIKMVRLYHPFTIGQRQDWDQSVQIRFTDDFKQRLSTRYLGNFDEVKFYPATGMIDYYYDLVIDLQCFHTISIIPYFRRDEGGHLIDCMRFLPSHKIDPTSQDVSASDSVTTVSDVTNCEQGSNFQDIITVTRSTLDIIVGFLKNLAIAAVSFIPVAGPFLAVGLDVAYDIVIAGADGEAFVNKALGDAGYDAAVIQGAQVVQQLSKILSKVSKFRMK
ncbi:hypothetical protein F5H01DRAFT_189569 [Linnemannia elongata]|nr:hypothetical protein F5H01DRAFT_189569 [Linnemannia elongata]